MSRLLDDFLYRTSLLTIVRGKCGMWEWTGRGGPCDESVRLVDNQWWGENSRGPECPGAPEQQCPTCAGTGRIELSPTDAELARYDGTESSWSKDKPCKACGATGYVPGPHWPFRYPEPPPLRARD